VLISHLHHHHCDLRSLRSLGRDRTVLVPGDTGGFFRRPGFTDVVAMQPGVTRQVGTVSVTTTPAAHDGRRLPLGPRRCAVGYVVTAGEPRLYVALPASSRTPRARCCGPTLRLHARTGDWILTTSFTAFATSSGRSISSYSVVADRVNQASDLDTRCVPGPRSAGR
jgi:hypothetical protein